MIPFQETVRRKGSTTRFAGENPGKTVWFVEPVQKMWRSESRWAGIVARKSGEPALWITDDPRRMWWPESICLHEDGEVGSWNGSVLLPPELAKTIVNSFRADLSEWKPLTYADSSVCAVSLTGEVLIGEKADKSFYKHYGLKNDTALGLYQKVLTAVKDCPAIRIDNESIQGKGAKESGNMYVVRKENGHYSVEVKGEDATARGKNFEALLRDFGIGYEVLSNVEVCHEFMAKMLTAQFDPLGKG